MAQGCQIPLQVLDIEAATNPTIASVCDYWCTLADGELPPRKAFDFMAVYKAAPYLLMAQRLAPETFKFIYCGTFVADNFPRDLTGAVYGPTTPRVSQVNWPGFFGEVLDVPCMQYGRVHIDWRNDNYGDLIYGACPLTGPNDTPAYVVCCLVFLRRSPFDAGP